VIKSAVDRLPLRDIFDAEKRPDLAEDEKRPSVAITGGLLRLSFVLIEYRNNTEVFDE